MIFPARRLVEIFVDASKTRKKNEGRKCAVLLIQLLLYAFKTFRVTSGIVLITLYYLGNLMLKLFLLQTVFFFTYPGNSKAPR